MSSPVPNMVQGKQMSKTVLVIWKLGIEICLGFVI